ncbi:WYL domain-containing protein [Clostridium sp. P21]|uniref:WYL domain-containing protein n=1 Tax=Clostridium muellerianum TaxID=2716538 RepID=A0A7Y0HRS5_9CLOT|nr:WYL domain-containing protein [Clostridium muellerianum]NMM65521.1 WYL domain-containing protein [Clostridium muellerianum]
MDKITRLLLLYSKLIQGEKVNKLSFCMETDSLPRTFDRDIEDVRLYLSELFCNEELIYDRQENLYYFAGPQRKALETMEYMFIERVLLDTGALRADEMDGLLTHLAGNAENVGKMVLHEKECIKKYDEPLHKKAILKMHGDLVTIISNKSVIKINYIKMGGEVVEREVIPCAIKYDLGYLYLIAFLQTSNKQYPAYFRLDRIYSFSVVRSQRMDERQRAAEYMETYSKGITQMYGGEFIEVLISCKKEFYSYIHDKFRNANIVEIKADTVSVTLNVFEDGFIKWIMSQPIELVQIIKPQEVKKKIINEAKKIVTIYAEVHE